MAIGKEIIVLSGGGHKGVVKISGVAGKENTARVSCSLDFRPSGTTLYVIGDNIAEITLNDINCNVEVPFCANGDIGCVVRSSSLTMFGGRGAKSLMLKKIDDFNRAEKLKKTNSSVVASNSQNDDVSAKTEKSEEFMSRQSQVKTASADDINQGQTCASANGAETCAAQSENSRSQNEEAVLDKSAEGAGRVMREPRVDAKAVNPLGDWTKYDGNNFYYAVKPQIDEMFVCYPEEKLLSESVPNSKWVRVDAEDGYYVVGLLYDEDEPSFICYGVPQIRMGKDARRAPAELENMCVWLPLGEDGEIEGYWMIYQSAKTGEIIK